MFSELEDDQLETLINSAKIIKLRPGDSLFYAGEPAQHFYYLESGQIRLFMESADGLEKTIDVVQPKELFAEAIPFFEHRTYPIHAQAIKNSEIYAFNSMAFRDVLKDSIDTCFKVMAGLTKRLRFQLTEIHNLTLHNATYRLVHHLLRAATANPRQQTQIALDYPKNVLASRLSVKPETLSRILLRLKKDQLIDVDGNQIILKDIEGLQRYLMADDLLLQE